MTYTPPPQLETLPDGSIRISVGEFSGTVSSGHLVEPKVHQLQAAWLTAHGVEAHLSNEP